MVLFSVLGWKSKGVKSKGNHKSKGIKAFKGGKAKSYIHKGLTKRSAEPWWGHSMEEDWDLSKGFYQKGDSSKGHSWKGKCVEFTILNIVLIAIVRKLSGTYLSLQCFITLHSVSFD